MGYLILITFSWKYCYSCFINEEIEVKGIKYFTVVHDDFEIETAFEMRKTNFKSPGSSSESTNT